MKELFRIVCVCLATMMPLKAVDASTLEYTDIVVFGDSLSSWRGRPPTDGKTWADVLLDRSPGATVVNYAEVGAYATDQRVGSDFAHQREWFSRFGPVLSDNPLGIVWIGANDLLGRVAPVADVAAAVADGVQRIALASPVRRFVIVGMPDLGTLPLSAGTARADQDSKASKDFNSAMESFVARGPDLGLELHYSDMAGLFSDMMDRPGAYGLTNTTGNCSYGDSVACEGFMFWDNVHFTSTTHAVIADNIVTTAAVPLPSGLWLLIAALGSLAATHRRVVPS